MEARETRNVDIGRDGLHPKLEQGFPPNPRLSSYVDVPLRLDTSRSPRAIAHAVPPLGPAGSRYWAEPNGMYRRFGYAPTKLRPTKDYAFVPTATMPGPVRVFAENQPVAAQALGATRGGRGGRRAGRRWNQPAAYPVSGPRRSSSSSTCPDRTVVRIVRATASSSATWGLVSE